MYLSQVSQQGCSATAGVTTYNNYSKVVHGNDDQSSSSTATLEYFEYGGFESLNKIPVARLSDGVLLNLQLLFTFEQGKNSSPDLSGNSQ